MVHDNPRGPEVPRLDIRKRIRVETRVPCLGDRHKLLAQSSLNVHLGPLQLSSTLKQLDQIVQVNYRAQSWILPRSLVNLVRIDHVPVRIVRQHYPRRVRLKALGELSQGVSCLLELFERPIELVTSPLQLRKHLPSVAISHRISALGPLFARNGVRGGHKCSLTHTPSPPKQGQPRTNETPEKPIPDWESAIPLPLTMGRFILRTLLLLAASHENQSPRAEDCVVSKLLVIIKKTLRPPLIPPVILLDLLSRGAPGSHSLRVELLCLLEGLKVKPELVFHIF